MRLFLFLAGACFGVLLSGCTSTRVLEPVALEPEVRGSNRVVAVKIESAVFDKGDKAPCVRALVTGSESSEWEAQKRRQGRVEQTVFSYDAPTFARLTHAVPVLSPSIRFFKSKWGFGLTRWVGLFPVTRWVKWDKIFFLSEWVGLFPLGKELAESSEHPLKEICGGDGNIDCPVFPCSFSDEEGNALFYSALYPIALLAEEFKPKVLLAPLALGLNPVIDTVAYSLDITAMSLAASAELVFVVMPPISDAVAMITATSLDACLATTVVACDTTLTTLTLTGDSLMWMGDAVYPSGVETTTNALPVEAVGGWEKQSGPKLPVDWSGYAVTFTCGDKVRTVEPGQAGTTLRVPLAELRHAGVFGAERQKVKVEIVDRQGRPVESVSVDVDFDVLQE